MTIDEVTRRIGEAGIVAVIRAQTIEIANRAVQAVCAGGIAIVEITMTVPGAVSIIAELAQQHKNDGILIGAGTVTSPPEAELCVGAGAKFLVSPGTSPQVLATAHKAGILAIPGALTPTELMTAQEHGARVIKIFPCGNVGGPKYLRALRAPFPDARLIPTGGVTTANAAEFIAAGAFALGIGADLVDTVALREGRTNKITAAAHDLVRVVTAARSAEATIPAKT